MLGEYLYCVGGYDGRYCTVLYCTILYCVGGYDGRDRAVATVERLHLRGDRWEPVADMNKVSVQY